MSETNDTGAITRFGFRWGPVNVTRRCLLIPRQDRETRVVGIKAGSTDLDVYVSKTGRSVRVFDQDGREWKP